MFKLVSFASLLAIASAGAPIGYGGYATQFAAPAYAQRLAPAYAPAPVYAQQAVHAVHAAPAYAPIAPAIHHAPVHAVHAAPIHAVAAPVAKVVQRVEPFDPHPQYNYGYSVSDSLTGDHHSAQESRDGDVVKGSYSLVEPDGAIRTVTYTADSVNGFNAVVDRQAPAVKQVAVAAPVHAVHAAPAIQYAPQAAYRPAVTAIHAAPAIQYAPQAAYRPAVTAIHAAPSVQYAPQAAYRPAVTAIQSAYAPAAYHH